MCKPKPLHKHAQNKIWPNTWAPTVLLKVTYNSTRRQGVGLGSLDLKFVACYINWCVCSGKDFTSSLPAFLFPSPFHFFLLFPWCLTLQLGWPGLELMATLHSHLSNAGFHNYTWLLIFKGQLWAFSHTKVKKPYKESFVVGQCSYIL